MQVKDLIIVSHSVCFSREKHEKGRFFSETTFGRFGGFKGEETAVMNQLGGKRLALASEAVKI